MRHESTAFKKGQAQLPCGYKAALYHVEMSLGNRIKQARKAARMTQAELGQHFGITSQAVSQWENDPTKGPQRDKMPKLARVLGVDLTVLSGDEESPASQLNDLIQGLSPEKQRQALRLIRAIAEEDKAA